MTRLVQAPTAIADCTEFTYSSWLWIPDASDDPTADNQVYQFGNRNDFLSQLTHPIGLIPSLGARFIGPNYFDTLAEVNTSQGMVITSLPNVFVFGQWNHLFITAKLADCSDLFGQTIGTDASHPNTGYMYLNAVSVADYGVHPVGQIIGVGGQTDGPVAPGSGIIVGSGNGVAIPTFGDDEPFQFSVVMKFAYTQIWFGKYIEPTPDNLSQFYTIKGSVIVPPTDPLKAQSFFGRSNVYFYRDKSSGVSFQTNKGTAGAFTVTGTPPKDYFPGPGQSATQGFRLMGEDLVDNQGRVWMRGAPPP